MVLRLRIERSWSAFQTDAMTTLSLSAYWYRDSDSNREENDFESFMSTGLHHRGMVREERFELSLLRILSSQPLPLGYSRMLESRAGFEPAMLDVGGPVPSAGRDMLVASSGIEPLSMEVETPSPSPSARQNWSRRWESNPHDQRWQRCEQPLSHTCDLVGRKGIEP